MLVASEPRNTAIKSPRDRQNRKITPKTHKSPLPARHLLPNVSLPLPKPTSGPRSPEFFAALIPTAWGVCGALWTQLELPCHDRPGPFASAPCTARLCRIILPGLSPCDLRRSLFRQCDHANEVLGDGRGNFHPEVVPEWFPELVRHLQSYYANGLRDGTQPDFIDSWTYWNPRLDWSQVTTFQRDVLRIVAEIEHGRRLTYGEVAKKLGNAKASRAVGAALRSNPWPVIVPCHRVVGSKGGMTGFSAPGGVSAKRRMLDMEEPGLLFR